MAKSAKLSVSIVLPNWNGESLLGKNLPVVIDAAPDAEIIVADDASSDGSVALLKKKFPGVIVVENRVQQGFAGNVNSGVAHATGDIVVLLNTDVRPEMDFLPPLLTSFADPRVFAVGCREKSHDPGGIVERGRGIARWERGFFVHARGEVNKTDTAWVSGGSSAFRRDLWNKFGGMDTIYNPFYWEDIDLSYRALKAGYRIMFEPKSVVGHFHEEGKIKTSYTKDDVQKIVYRNQFIFLWKNMSDTKLWLAHACWLPYRVLQAALRGDRLFIGGLLLALGMIPSIRRRRAEQSAFWHIADTTLFPSR